MPRIKGKFCLRQEAAGLLAWIKADSWLMALARLIGRVLWTKKKIKVVDWVECHARPGYGLGDLIPRAACAQLWVTLSTSLEWFKLFACR